MAQRMSWRDTAPDTASLELSDIRVPKLWKINNKVKAGMRLDQTRFRGATRPWPDITGVWTGRVLRARNPTSLCRCSSQRRKAKDLRLPESVTAFTLLKSGSA